ncbi:hypothetical protein BDV59DRAFT_174778 [Aspergillus ambiguus]|uniref:uncharacterized protein n=1 Tax=Aspergillus ambiguus TaxID=176160 RepID=UPI003CCDE0F3
MAAVWSFIVIGCLCKDRKDERSQKGVSGEGWYSQTSGSFGIGSRKESLMLEGEIERRKHPALKAKADLGDQQSHGICSCIAKHCSFRLF